MDRIGLMREAFKVLPARRVLPELKDCKVKLVHRVLSVQPALRAKRAHRVLSVQPALRAKRVHKVHKAQPEQQVLKVLPALRVLSDRRVQQVRREFKGKQVPKGLWGLRGLPALKVRRDPQVLLEPMALQLVFKAAQPRKMTCRSQAIRMVMVTLFKIPVFYGYGMVMDG
jgi:hypothetical protein